MRQSVSSDVLKYPSSIIVSIHRVHSLCAFRLFLSFSLVPLTVIYRILFFKRSLPDAIDLNWLRNSNTTITKITRALFLSILHPSSMATVDRWREYVWCTCTCACKCIPSSSELLLSLFLSLPPVNSYFVNFHQQHTPRASDVCWSFSSE